ncbi:hypothetical protein ACFQ1S_45095, partial [Kibdelosporangium lantanae]
MDVSLGMTANGSVSGYLYLNFWPYPENLERLEATAVHRQQIEQDAQGVFVARPGFSGTPVVDELTGRMLGLVVATATGRDSTDVYAIPLVSLTGAWPEVFSSVPSSPYKGLEAFEREDRAVFFGRLAITEELVRRVDTSGLVPVVGASGVGKSSLVHAGLVPRLLEQSTSRWTIVSV